MNGTTAARLAALLVPPLIVGGLQVRRMREAKRLGACARKRLAEIEAKEQR